MQGGIAKKQGWREAGAVERHAPFGRTKTVVRGAAYRRRTTGKEIRTCRSFFTVNCIAAIALIVAAPRVIWAQGFPYDRQLLEKLDRGHFESIPRTQIAFLDVHSVMMAFGNRCSLERGSDDMAKAAVRAHTFLMWISRNRIDLSMQMALIAMQNPNTHRATALVACNS